MNNESIPAEKKVVSPFEFAIMQSAMPEEAKEYRAETREEKETRLKAEFSGFASKIKIKK